MVYVLEGENMKKRFKNSNVASSLPNPCPYTDITSTLHSDGCLWSTDLNIYSTPTRECINKSNDQRLTTHAQDMDRNLSGVVCDCQWMMPLEFQVRHSAERKNVIVLWSWGNLWKKSPSFTKTHILLNMMVCDERSQIQGGILRCFMIHYTDRYSGIVLIWSL